MITDTGTAADPAAAVWSHAYHTHGIHTYIPQKASHLYTYSIILQMHTIYSLFSCTLLSALVTNGHQQEECYW